MESDKEFTFRLTGEVKREIKLEITGDGDIEIEAFWKQLKDGFQKLLDEGQFSAPYTHGTCRPVNGIVEIKINNPLTKNSQGEIKSE
jgi:hypothetical protein